MQDLLFSFNISLLKNRFPKFFYNFKRTLNKVLKIFELGSIHLINSIFRIKISFASTYF